MNKSTQMKFPPVKKKVLLQILEEYIKHNDHENEDFKEGFHRAIFVVRETKND